MTLRLDALPKPAKTLPEEAQRLFVEEYNKDFAWQCSEAHAEKAAWNAVRRRWTQDAEGAWIAK